MPLNHSDATAVVLMDGLGICCFNREQRLWEVAYLNHEHHQLILDITRDGTLVRPQQTLGSPKSVRIYADKPVRPNFEEYPDGFFDGGALDRKTDPAGDVQKENFRWVVDLEDGGELPHGNVTLKKPDYPVVLAHIEDAVFYTRELIPEGLFLLQQGVDANQVEQQQLERRRFGKVNDQIAADIMCEDGGCVVIEVDGEVLATLEKSPGPPYLIDLSNMRAEADEQDEEQDEEHEHGHDHGHGHGHGHGAGFKKIDFSIYYDVINVTGKPLAMWGKPPVFRSGRISCNICRVSGFDSLSDLTS